MENKRTPIPSIATDSPRPGDFPIGSAMSRAAARAMLESRAAADDGGFLLVVRSVLLSREEADTCVEILRECGFIAKTGCRVVNFCNIPESLKGPELERWLREHG